jgi:hypothetical protein
MGRSGLWCSSGKSSAKMDMAVKLIQGGVYKTILSPEPLRVLAFDNFEVHYDAFWSSLDKWTHASDLKSSGIYYRSSADAFLKNATFIREQPLTEDEFRVFRYLNQFNIETSGQIVLPVPSITLEPFGSKKRTALLKSTLVSSIDPSGFTEIELLWQANNVQAQQAKHIIEKGVGIYRKGHEKKVPSYYIWGYYDAAGLLQNNG